MDQQNIEVRASSLKNVMTDVASGRYRIPQFQREYVWKKRKVADLLDSIYQEFPIGSFFIWKANRDNNDLFRQAGELDIPHVKPDDDVSFIIDGQQRITSLYVTLNGLQIKDVDYAHMCFDLREETFAHRSSGPDNRRYVSVCDIWGAKAVSLMRNVDQEYLPAFERIFETLKTYPISIVEVRDKELPEVCKIFQRINQSGKRLDRFDLISAMTFTKTFDLREKMRADIQDVLKVRGFGTISPIIVTQLMALLKLGTCTERNEFDLSTEDITRMWHTVVDSVLLAVDTLRKALGVIRTEYLPYDAQLTLLAYAFARTQDRSLSAPQMDWISKWFWRSSFGAHYGAGGATRIGRDREVFDRMLDGDPALAQIPVNLTAAQLVGTKMTWSRAAIRNAFMCLLATRNPRHLGNNTPLNLADGSVSGFTSAEKHHIFPVAFLRQSDEDESLVHAVPNFCFLPSDLNKLISNQQPSLYFPELRSKNPSLDESLRAQLLPSPEANCISHDDYIGFLNSRSEMLLDEIRRLCGITSAPRPEQRFEALEILEKRIRDRIHAVLQASVGDDYWKQAVPEEIRKQATLRERSDAARVESSGTARDRNRHLLSFLTVGEYSSVICNKANWQHFQNLFRKREVVTDNLNNLADYRNAVMHSREMSEYVRLGGERAMVWLETVLPEEPNGSDSEGLPEAQS